MIDVSVEWVVGRVQNPQTLSIFPVGSSRDPCGFQIKPRYPWRTESVARRSEPDPLFLPNPNPNASTPYPTMTTDLPPDVDPYSVPIGSPSLKQTPKKRLTSQSILVIGIYAVFSIAGAFEVFSYENSTAYYACSIAFAILATAWAINDNRVRGGVFHPALRLLYLIACPLSPVIYLTWTRGMQAWFNPCSH